MIAWIGTGSAYNAAKFLGSSRGFPRIGEVEGESEAEITRPGGPETVSVVFVAGLILGLGFELRFKVGGDSGGMVSPHLGKKHDVILTADASGRSRSNTLLLRGLLLSEAVEVDAGIRIPGMNEVGRDGGGVLGRLLPALTGSELVPSPIRLRENNFLAIPLPRPKAGGVRLLKTDPKRPFDFPLAVPWAGVIFKVNAASELE